MTVALSTTAWWAIGWALGALVVLIAAGLLLAIIALARRIVAQAGDIVEAIEGARTNTEALFDVASVNHSLERIHRGLVTPPANEPPPRDSGHGIVGQITDTIRGRREGRA